MSITHAGNTNGCALLMSPSVFLSLSHAFLFLMDRWHAIVYWAKVQCLIGHSSGNWASVSAWPSSILPPKRKEEGKKARNSVAYKRKGGGWKEDLIFFKPHCSDLFLQGIGKTTSCQLSSGKCTKSCVWNLFIYLIIFAGYMPQHKYTSRPYSNVIKILVLKYSNATSLAHCAANIHSFGFQA